MTLTWPASVSLWLCLLLVWIQKFLGTERRNASSVRFTWSHTWFRKISRCHGISNGRCFRRFDNIKKRSILQVFFWENQNEALLDFGSCVINQRIVPFAVGGLRSPFAVYGHRFLMHVSTNNDIRVSLFVCLLLFWFDLFLMALLIYRSITSFWGWVVLVAQLVSRRSCRRWQTAGVVRFPAGLRERLKTVDPPKGNGLGQKNELFWGCRRIDGLACTFTIQLFCCGWTCVTTWRNLWRRGTKKQWH